MIRIISGKHRHRLLEEPNSNNTRPTQDRVRQAVFNSLNFEKSKQCFLDLFAGSGAIGIEAISNGYENVYFVEKDAQICNIIKNNLESIEVDNNLVFNENALSFIENINIEYDVIYLDPPYAMTQLLNEILKIIAQRKLLKEDGALIIETRNWNEIIVPDQFRAYKHKKYGKTELIYLTL